MSSLNLVVVYHPNCKASTDFLIKVSKVQEAEIEYINVKEDKIETGIDIDVVPLLIIDNDPSKIFKGKKAFDKVESLLTTEKPASKKHSGNRYTKNVTFVEEGDKKEKIDLSKR
tara:strand:- start:1141 stop:1482 length:342 start_codon:yes stop_codon:yes gene_type:complete